MRQPVSQVISGCFNHMTRLDTICTYKHFFHPALMHRSYPLEVGFESSFVQIMGMTYMMADNWLFSA